ncbi:type I methionyl aminopeptidase [candidate division NPL-UPA2 bacterium]|nr:type I methionyl aminopeptidase [candidate division NPL-UPA2 bacterium]
MILLKSERELKIIKECNRIAAEVHQMLSEIIRPGVTTAELEEFATKLIREREAEPAFKGYRGFPGCICTSVNEEVVHGIPGSRKLTNGDIISLDIGVRKNGYYGDAAVTWPVGTVTEEVKRLLEVTRRALYRGIDQARMGGRLYDISHAIQTEVEAEGFSIVRDFVGHGIGAKMHEDPQIPNFGKAHRGPRLKKGMVLAIEPMVNIGGYEVKVLSDNWTVVTGDGKPSAHFEHTILITRDGPEILTEV